MCADLKGIILKKIGRHIGSDAPVIDVTPLEGTPEAVDPEREKQVQPDEAELEAWLRSRDGSPWMEGIVEECLERFPQLERFQVSAVIYELKVEDSAREIKLWLYQYREGRNDTKRSRESL